MSEGLLGPAHLRVFLVAVACFFGGFSLVLIVRNAWKK
jgi:hypothetical protein